MIFHGQSLSVGYSVCLSACMSVYILYLFVFVLQMTATCPAIKRGMQGKTFISVESGIQKKTFPTMESRMQEKTFPVMEIRMQPRKCPAMESRMQDNTFLPTKSWMLW